MIPTIGELPMPIERKAEGPGATYIVCYHGNHCLNPIFLGSESGCHGNVLYNR